MPICSAFTRQGAWEGFRDCDCLKNRMSHKKRSKTRPRTHRDRRAVSQLYPLDLVYFCVEGDTEEAYIKGLMRHSYGGHLVPKFRGSRHNTSLKNLLEAAKRGPDDGDTPVGTWIVCDTDENGVHQEELYRWAARKPAEHRYALTNPCLEYWLILHYSDTASCLTPIAAEAELRKHLSDYKKGTLPDSIFDGTEAALSRESRRHPAPAAPQQGWPEQRSSQIPRLIVWLDQRAADHERRQRLATERASRS